MSPIFNGMLSSHTMVTLVLSNMILLLVRTRSRWTHLSHHWYDVTDLCFCALAKSMILPSTTTMLIMLQWNTLPNRQYSSRIKFFLLYQPRLTTILTSSMIGDGLVCGALHIESLVVLFNRSIQVYQRGSLETHSTCLKVVFLWPLEQQSLSGLN